jgi:hypothetical protein
VVGGFVLSVLSLVNVKELTLLENKKTKGLSGLFSFRNRLCGHDGCQDLRIQRMWADTARPSVEIFSGVRI